MARIARTYLDDLPIENLEIILKSSIGDVALSYEDDLAVLNDLTSKSIDAHSSLSVFFSASTSFRALVSSVFTTLILFDTCGTEFSIYRGVIMFSPKSHIELESGLIRQVFSICGSSSL